MSTRHYFLVKEYETHYMLVRAVVIRHHNTCNGLLALKGVIQSLVQGWTLVSDEKQIEPVKKSYKTECSVAYLVASED